MKHEPNEIRAELCRRDFFFFVKEFWDVIIPEPPIYNWHIPYLCKELQQIAEQVKRREPKLHDLLINIPPGTTKTTICSSMYPAWVWTIDPTQRILTTSYSSTLAEKSAVKSKDIIKSQKYRDYFDYVEIRNDIDNRSNFQNTKGGERLALGLGGAALGNHAHQIINDDPLNITEAQSDLVRRNTNERIDTITSTRKVDKEITPVITIMQRLHEDDTAGHILSRDTDKLKHINLPAEDNGKVKPSFLKTKYKDGLLDNLRLNRAVLKEMLSTLGSYGYAGQMQQEPAPSDGGMIKNDWFVYINFEEFKTKTIGKNVVWNFEVDGAFTSKKENAQSAILAWCYIDNIMYIREVTGVWEELPEFINTLKSFALRNEYSNASRINVEAKATGLPIIHTLRRSTGLNVIEDKMVTTTGIANDKISRVHAAVPFIEGRRLVLIKGDWNESFVHQCCVFPKGKLKDKVDCLTAAIHKAVEDKNTVMGWSIG